MARLRPDFQSGKLTDASISATVQQLNSPGFANLPTVASPDTLVLSLDPLGIYGLPEIVTITDHASGATVVTVERGTDGSVTFAAGVPGGPRAHNQNGVQEDWYASQTGQDYVHGNLDGLDVPGDHAWAALVDGSRPITGDQTFEAGINVTGASSFADTVTGPTAPAGTSNTQLATTQFVMMALGNSSKNILIVTASETWTPPSGVNYLDELWLIGGGGGGQPGGGQAGGNGGGGGTILGLRGVPLVGGQSVSIVIGAGGTGGVGASYVENSGATGYNPGSTSATSPTDGGATSFGSISVPGGSAGTNSIQTQTANTLAASPWKGYTTAEAGGNGAYAQTQSNGYYQDAGASAGGDPTPYLTFLAALAVFQSGQAGAAATGTTNLLQMTLQAGGATTLGLGGGGGGGGNVYPGGTSTGTAPGAPGGPYDSTGAPAGGGAGGGGGAGYVNNYSVSGTGKSGAGGNGGNAAANTGGGGGGGGAFAQAANYVQSFNYGSGGNGASGLVIMVWTSP